MSLIYSYLQMLFDPKRAFQHVTGLKVWTLLVPLFLSIFFTAALNVYYFTHVDFGWLTDQMAASFPAGQRESIIRTLTLGRLMTISLIGVVVLAIFINLARAFGYWIVLKILGNSSAGFVSLFAIVVWSTAPLTLILPAGLLNISLAAEGRIAGNDVNPVSLNQLIFHLPSNTAWGQLLSTFSLVNVWEIVLIGIGLSVITGFKWGRCALVAAIPDLIVYGTWAGLLAISGAR